MHSSICAGIIGHRQQSWSRYVSGATDCADSFADISLALPPPSSSVCSRHIAGAAPPRAVLRAPGHHAVGPQLPHRAAHLADLQPHRLLQAPHTPLPSHGRGAGLAEQRQRRQGEDGGFWRFWFKRSECTIPCCQITHSVTSHLSWEHFSQCVDKSLKSAN